MGNRHEYIDKLLEAFPSELYQEVEKIIAILPYNETTINIFNEKHTIVNLICETNISVKINSEIINIPYRIYFNEPQDGIKLTGIQESILCCIYSRHYNGYIRQKYIEKIKRNDDYWVTPFYVQLFGEYIYEIMGIFDEYLNTNMNNCIKFINENPVYWEKTKNRMVSYWNEFYRGKYPDYRNYLGRRIIGKINGIKNSVIQEY